MCVCIYIYMDFKQLLLLSSVPEKKMKHVKLLKPSARTYANHRVSNMVAIPFLGFQNLVFSLNVFFLFWYNLIELNM